MGSIGTAFVSVGGDLSGLEKAFQQAIPSAEKLGAQAGKAYENGLTSAMGSGLSNYVSNVEGAFRQFGTALDGIASTVLPRLRQGLSDVGGQLTGLGTRMTLGVTAPLVAFGKEAIDSATRIESLKNALTTVTGSANATNVEFERLREVAKLPGLGLPEAVQGSVRLQEFGFSAKGAREALMGFGNAIASAGGGRAELDRVIVQLGQMAGASKVLTQDLRPILQTVPQVSQIIREKFGSAALSDPSEAISKLGLSSKQFIEVLVTELGKLPKVTGGLRNELENFRDTVTISFSQVGQAMAPMVHEVMERAVPAIEGLTQRFVNLSPHAQRAAVTFGAVAAASGPAVVALGTVAKSVGDLSGVIGTLITKAGGLGTVTMGIAAVGGAFAAIHLTGLDSAMMRFWESLDHAWDVHAASIEQLAESVGHFASKLLIIEPSKIAQMASSLSELTGIDFSNLFSLQSIAERMFPQFELLTKAFTDASAILDVMSGRAKNMTDALSGMAGELDKAIDKQRHFAQTAQDAQLKQTLLEGAVKQAANAYTGLFEKYQQGLVPIQAVVNAEDDLIDALRRAHPELSTSSARFGELVTASMAGHKSLKEVGGAAESSKDALKRYHEQLKLVGGFSTADIEKQAKSFEAVAQAVAKLTLLGVDVSKMSEMTARDFARIGEATEKAKNEAAAATETYRLYFDLMQRGQATSQQMAMAHEELVRALAKANPQLDQNSEAFRKLVQQAELGKNAIDGMNVVMVKTADGGSVKLITALNNVAGAAGGATAAIQQTESVIMNMDGTMTTASEAVKKLSSSTSNVASNAKAASTGMGALGESIKGVTVDAAYMTQWLIGMAGSTMAALMIEPGLKGGASAESIAFRFQHPNGIEGKPPTKDEFDAMKRASRGLPSAAEDAAMAAAALAKIAESAKGLEKVAVNMSAVDEELRKQSDALYQQLVQVTDQMRAMQDAGEEDSDAFRALQQRMFLLNNSLAQVSEQASALWITTKGAAGGVQQMTQAVASIPVAFSGAAMAVELASTKMQQGAAAITQSYTQVRAVSLAALGITAPAAGVPNSPGVMQIRAAPVVYQTITGGVWTSTRAATELAQGTQNMLSLDAGVRL